jgi:hypothetical protein
MLFDASRSICVAMMNEWHRIDSLSSQKDGSLACVTYVQERALFLPFLVLTKRRCEDSLHRH